MGDVLMAWVEEEVRIPRAEEETISCLAYQLYEQRGRTEGYALDDWLKAELAVKQSPSSRFPLEWIEQAAVEDDIPEGNAPVAGQVVALRRWPYWVQWTLIGLAVLMGGMAVGAMKAKKAVMAEQLSLSAGYRAILFRPRSVGR